MSRPLLSGAAESTGFQFLRYGFVGAIAFVVDFAVLVGTTELAGVNYLTSAVFGFGAGLTVNYLLSVTWVFANRSLENRMAEFTVFLIIGVIGLGLTELILFSGTELARLDYRISKIGAVLIVFLWNFGARKAILFRNKRQDL